jgi:hypothetical protein
MNQTMNQDINPLARVALGLPVRTGFVLSLVGRVAGIVLALAVIGDQDYDRTRAFAGVVAALAALSLIPRPTGLARRLTWVGAGVLFFGGALLASIALGKLLILSGVIAAAGAAIEDRQQGRMTGAPSFFAGFGLVSVMVAVIVLMVEG